MLDLAYIVLCVIAALVAFWGMQCLTAHAGVYCARSRAIAILRIAMAVLAAALLYDAYAVADRAASASIGGTVLVVALLVFLICCRSHWAGGTIPCASARKANPIHKS